jgi:hypothetical protein
MGYILLDGVSNETMGLGLERVIPFVYPRRTRSAEAALDGLTSLEGEWVYSPTPIPIYLLAKGTDKAAAIQKFQDAAAWLINARELRLSSNAARYYLGSIQNAEEPEQLSSHTFRLKAEFLCNPPCWHRVNTDDADFKPNLDARLPEQITAGKATVQAAFAAPGLLPQVTYTAAHPAALYFAVEGTFTTFTLGGAAGLVLNWETPQSMTVYLDCVAQVVYHLLGGVLTAIPYSGEFPALTKTGQIAVGGTGLNATVKLLVIERG